MQFKLIKNFKFQIKNYRSGFTLIELIVVIALIAILSGIILFSITQYISKGKDSNVAGSLAVLVPAGEVFYNGNNSSYSGFCDPEQNSVLKNSIFQMPAQSPDAPCYNSVIGSSGNPVGLCCSVSPDNNSWVACAREFADPTSVFCVDSRGIKKSVVGNCNVISASFKCPWLNNIFGYPLLMFFKRVYNRRI